MKIKRILVYFCAILISIVVLFPYSWTILSSMKTWKQLTVPTPTLELADPWWGNYYTLFVPEFKQVMIQGSIIPFYAKQFTPGLINSMLTAIITIPLVLFVSSLSAFSFARSKFKGSNLLMGVYLATRTIPSVVIIIPVFIIMRNIGMVDTIIGLSIVLTGVITPYSILILREHFKSIPEDLFDSAEIDGASTLQTFVQIALPLIIPGLIVSSIFVFMAVWNSFTIALIITNTIKSIQMPVIVSMFVSDIDVDYGMMCAAGVLGGLPPILIAIVLQKYIVTGLMQGAVKG